MYRSTPPPLGACVPPLRMSRAARRVFDEDADSARDPAYRTYLEDMLRPYGLGVDAESLGAGRGQSYGDMASALLAQVASDDQPVDLLVMAFAVPDVMPWRCTASHLSHLCPGSPAAFAVCDCGNVAAFTGLRLIHAHAAGASSPRALLMVLEQAAINHELPIPAATPVRHAAVALRFGPAGSSLVDSVRLRAGVATSEAGRLLAAEVAELSAGHGDVTVIAGTALAEAAGGSDMLSGMLPAASEVLLAPAGQPCTGVWWQVAGLLDGWTARERRVLVADYDPLPGSLCLAAIDVAASSPPLPR